MILDGGWRKVMVLGAVDTGKSTYCRFLSKRLARARTAVALIDADIGQKDIGPPATITLAYPEAPDPSTYLRPASLYFVGSVSPSRHLLPMVIGTRRMLDASRADYAIINTTGLIHGVGRVLKGYKIEALCPDVIVAIERTNETRSLLRSYRNYRAIRLKPSPMVATKTPEDRRAAREHAFRDYFRNAEEVSLDINRIAFQRSLLFSGRRIEDGRFLHCEKTSEGILAVRGETQHGLEKDMKFIPTGFEKDLLCGVVDRRSFCLGLAIVRKIDFKLETLTLCTPVSPDKISAIQPGDIYICSSGQELNRRKPGDF